MKITDPAGRMLHGRVGNMIYYSYNGKTYARRVSVTGEKKRSPRSEKQRASSERFYAMQMLYKWFREKVSPDIWRLAAKRAGMMPHNLFHRANHGCIDGEGRMADPMGFRFSDGELLLPWEIAVESLGDGRFRALWVEERDGVTATATDRLLVGVLYDTSPMSARLVPGVSGTRGDGQGEFTLDPGQGQAAHVYLFFEREDGTAYSPSRCFRVTW